MNPASFDILEVLVSERSFKLDYERNIFTGFEPASPANCVTIFDTVGKPPTSTLSGGEEGMFFPSIQVRVRNISYDDGWNLINDIKVFLHDRAKETWGDILYCSIICSMEPALLHWDANKRAVFVTTFNIQRREI